MERHYELLKDDFITVNGVTLYRIKATKNSSRAKKGDLGGYIQGYHNLAGNAWVSDNALVYDNALVFGDAFISENAQVFGNAWVSDNALVYDNAKVFGYARIYGYTQVYGRASVYGGATVYGDAWILGDAEILSNNDYCTFQNFGSANRVTTFFKTRSGGIYVKCGCFKGSLEDFEKQVKQTHESNKFAKEYLSIIEVVKIKFEIE